MKSVEELNAIRDKYKNDISIRTDEKEFLLVVGMGNSGIVSGARDILHELVRLVEDNNLIDRVRVMQKAKAAMPGHNPVVKLYEGRELTVYTDVTKEIAKIIVEEHIMKGNIIDEYTFKGEEE